LNYRLQISTEKNNKDWSEDVHEVLHKTIDYRRLVIEIFTGSDSKQRRVSKKTNSLLALYSQCRSSRDYFDAYQLL
jgi:hypothetical protein